MICRSTLFRPVIALFAVTLGCGCSDEDKQGGGRDSDTTNSDAADGSGDVGDGGDGGDTVILPDTSVTEIDAAEEVEAEVIITPGGFGSPCNENGDCESGYCVDGPKGYVCTRTCDTTCPEGYDCKAVSGGSDTVFLCLPRLRDNCTPCSDNFQCQGGLCMDIDGEGHCAYECGKDDDCPGGFTCDETEQAPGLFCQPTTGSCTCFAENDGGLRSCTTPSELGVCVGVSECDVETGWSACSAVAAAPEVCNGMDDDCNGVWDDNLEGAGGACVNAVAGVGECKGVRVCLGVPGWLCVGPTPVAEVCNGLDDNCDGVADDPFKNAAGGYDRDDNCGGCGVVCEGKIANATAYCATTGATPRCEVEQCAPGYYKAGPLTCLPIEDFSCVPCLVDAHCTTPGDRCLSIDGGNFCGRDCAAGNAHQSPAGQCPGGYSCEDVSASEGPGVRQCIPTSGSCTCLAGDAGEQRPCSRQADGATCFGAETCNPGSGWSTCDAKAPSPETCNALDDNCNGVSDDVPGRFEACTVTNTFGACPGAFDCRPGSTGLTCAGQVPSTEVCNGRDDDCNGQTDNILPPLCAKQTGVCAGSRQLCAGSAGFLGCNIGSYGATFETTETKCDGLDNDCDGQVDEVDIDGDGHRPLSCGGDDCDDTDRLSYPGASELCGDFADNDCNGEPDDRDFDQDGWIAVQCGGPDCNDNSALAKPNGVEVCGDSTDNDCDGSVDNKDADLDGFIASQCGGPDCNDARSDVKPGAIELCDGIDNNCDTKTDDKDADADGYIAEACGGNDCDDTSRVAHPGAQELCGDFADNDCNGERDDLDFDQDGWIAVQCGGDDCNDNSDAATPNGVEVCGDLIDNDCDGSVDNKDGDLDGFIASLCGGPDCDDARSDVKPGALELCDGIDNNCDTKIDDKDYDHDGYKDFRCGGDDCDDTRPLANPAGTEVCNDVAKVDEDCSGNFNDRDLDKDGFIAIGCSPDDVPGNDCDDFDPQTGPGLTEVWDTKDNDCDKSYDEGALDLSLYPNILIITEIMGDPKTVSEFEGGEYFEVTNVTPYPVNMRGWRVQSTNDPGFTVNQELIVQPGQALTFCQNSANLSASGVPCSFEYNVGVIFSNDPGDSVSLYQTLGGLPMDAITLDVTPTDGRARILKSAFYSVAGNDNYTNNWCPIIANSMYDLNGATAGGDYGTPGTVNPRDCSATPPAGAAFAIPSDGIGLGGDSITIYGRGFVSGQTTVEIGGTPCTGVSWVSSNEVQCITGAHAQGSVSIGVTVNGVATTLNAAFTYTNSGNGNFTAVELVKAPAYTIAAASPGPVIVASVAPAGLLGIRAQVGYGPSNSDPATVGGWKWFPAIKLTSTPSETYGRSLLIPDAGTFAYGFRFSQDGITWRYTTTSTATITP